MIFTLISKEIDLVCLCTCAYACVCMWMCMCVCESERERGEREFAEVLTKLVSTLSREMRDAAHIIVITERRGI